MANQFKARPLFLAASTAFIAVIGAWYGAGLKQDQEIKQKAKTLQEATPADKIAILEHSKSGLMAKKLGLENKIAQLEARQANKSEKEISQGRQF